MLTSHRKLLVNAIIRCVVVRNHTRMNSDDVIFTVRNCAGIVTLNRPKALNALNLSMLRKLYPKLKEWEADDKIKLVMVEGAGDKAFCAGGDIRVRIQYLLLCGSIIKPKKAQFSRLSRTEKVSQDNASFSAKNTFAIT